VDRGLPDFFSLNVEGSLVGKTVFRLLTSWSFPEIFAAKGLGLKGLLHIPAQRKNWSCDWCFVN